MNIDVPVSDARKIEVVCNGLPLWHGAQLAVDATLVSPLTRDGQPQPAADAQPGVALARAAQRKRRHTYPELLRARLYRLVDCGIETGGRWSEEAANSRDLPPTSHEGPRSQRTCRRAPRCSSRLVYRWSGILSVATLHELLADARWLQAPANSRLPARPA